jgi:Hsp70 protein
MSEPILVVDPGSAMSTAALVTGSESQLLKEPSSGSYCWPTSVALDGQVLRAGTIAERRKRAEPQCYAGQLTDRLDSGTGVSLDGRQFGPEELMAALLGVLRAEAQRLASAPVDRVLALVPSANGPATRAGQAMLAAAGIAGFSDAELLFGPAAAAMAAPEPAAGLVLVCDAGASAFRTTLLAVMDGRPGVPRAQSAVAACGGNQLDALLTGAMQKKHGKWLRPLLAAGGTAGARARLDLADLARRLRHEITDTDQAEDTFSPVTPVVRLARQDLEKWMKAPVAEVISRCREVLAQSGGQDAAKASGGAALTVMLVGGCARTPAIQRAVATAAGRPVTPAPAPELAPLRGGIEWAMSAADHRVPACPVPVGVRGLSWDMPDGAARLISWRVSPGTGYGPGEPLAAVRAPDDSVWDLTDDRPGTLAQTHPGPGTIVATGDLLAITRKASVTAGDLRGTPLRHSALPGGEFAAFSQDGMQLATLDTGRILRIWDTETAAELGRHEIKATLRRNGLDAARTADGDWLAAYFDGAAVIVWNVTAGKQAARVSKGKDPQLVRFSADGQRLCTADLRHARIWEVTGQELLSVKDRWQSTASVAMSPDGRRLAVIARAGMEVWEQAGRKRTLARALPRFKGKVWYLAFSADGEKVLFAYDTTMELAAVPSGTSLWTVADTVPVSGADFAAGGRLLATVSVPGGSLVTLRDPATGAEVGSLGAGDGPSGAARFSADGRFLVTAAADTSVVWALVR